MGTRGWALLALALPCVALAQEDGLSGLSLEELLQMEIDVAARSARTIRESPGVVSLVTREEIAALGARDLTDVLLRVPGIAFAMDVGGIEGIGFRGVWGHEGKVLLLVDGQEMNENLYSTTQWGHHIPADLIERIEIIRGPGSAIYGGYAELAVINVITRRGRDLDGGYASVAHGQIGKGPARDGVSVAYGRQLEGGLEFSLAGSFDTGRRSDRRFEDFYGSQYSMLDHSTLTSGFGSVGVAWKGASLRYVFDDYRMRIRDGYDAIYEKTYDQSFSSHLAEAKYDAKIGSITLTPRLSYRHQTPWKTAEKSEGAPFYDKSVERFVGGLTGAWRSGPIELLAGAEAFQDRAFLNDDDLVGFQAEFADGKTSVSYSNVAGFSQLLLDNPVANLALGARYENHSEFGDSFVPRAALTKVIDRWHVKLLYSNAFRAPGIENLRLNEDIQPERTTVFEAETGYRLTPGAFITANVFDVTVKDPIIYFYSDEEGEAYLNDPQTGSRGAEVEVRVLQERRRATLGLSVYDATGKNEVDLYESGNESALLGLPQLKLVATLGGDLGEHVSLDGSAVLLGPRRGYLEGDGEGGAEIGEADPVLLVDVFLRWRDAFLKGLDAGLGVYNVADSDYRLIQPYAGYHAPMPTGGREVLARLSYRF